MRHLLLALLLTLPSLAHAQGRARSAAELYWLGKVRALERRYLESSLAFAAAAEDEAFERSLEALWLAVAMAREAAAQHGEDHEHPGAVWALCQTLEAQVFVGGPR